MFNSREIPLSFRELEKTRQQLFEVTNKFTKDGYLANLYSIVCILNRLSLIRGSETYLIKELFHDSFLFAEKQSDLDINIDPSSMGYLIDYIFQYNLACSPAGDITKHNLRKSLGAFFTPFKIAKFIVTETITSFDSPSVLDPACGTGVFLSATSELLAAKGKNNNQIIDALHGWDKNKDALKIAQILISIELGLTKQQQKRFYKKKSFIEKDSIAEVFEEENLFTEETKINSKPISYIVTNPPYDRLKADGAIPEHKAQIAEYAKKIKSSNNYPLSTSGSLDLYRLFFERIINLTKQNSAKAGIIIPASFAGDKSAYKLRKHIIENRALSSILFIPEKARAFEGVTQAFSIVFFGANEKNIKKIKTGICENPSKISWDKTNTISFNDIKQGFPSELNIVCMPKDGYSLLKQLNKFPTVKSTSDILNKRGELDLSINKNFLEGEEKRLLRGKHVGEYILDKNMDSIKYKKYLKHITGSSKHEHTQAARLICQQISNMDSKKRLKFAIAPKNVILGNSLNYIYVGNDKEYLFGLLAIMNSILMDWRFRITSTNNHINNYEIDALPVPVKKDEIRILGKSIIRMLPCINKMNVRSAIENSVLSLYECEEYKKYLSTHHPLGSIFSFSDDTEDSILGEKIAS